MAQSMTGYGQAEQFIAQTKLNVEIKTVNHRFLDISLNVPHFLHPYEEQIKTVIRSYFKRGRIDVYITSEENSGANQTVVIDWGLLEAYNAAVESIVNTYPETSQLLITKLPEITDVFQIAEKSEAKDQLIEAIIKLIQGACQRVVQMRQAEGNQLIADINLRIKNLKALLDRLAIQREKVMDQHYQRMVDRLNNLLTKNSIAHNERFYHELAILAEKGDLTEELIRMESHIKQIKMLLKAKGEIGRKTDFIVQELVREANTMGSKANDPIISESVVELKVTIEKIKEQVQNIE